MEQVKNLFMETAEKLRAMANDSENIRQMRNETLILADELDEKAVEFDPEYVKVCSSEYPDEGHTFILKQDYEANPDEWTILS